MAYENLRSIQPARLLAEVAYAQLSEGILRKELPPGTSLSVPELSRRLEISRSPVREAVQRLIHDGLADYRGRRGTVVLSIDLADFLALLEVRAVLEGLAAGLAAERGTDREIVKLQEKHDAFLALSNHVGEEPDFVELDMSFHKLIREMARNDELATLLARTQARAHLSMHGLWSGTRNVEEAQREHGMICEAIVRRDEHGAADAARRHVTNLADRAGQQAEVSERVAP